MRLALGLLRVVEVRLRAPSRAPGALGQCVAPLLVVPLVVAHVLLARHVHRVDDAEPHTQLPQPPRDGVDRGGGDDQEPEDRQQQKQRNGEDLAHREDEWLGGSPADQPARVLHGPGPVLAAGRAAGDVDLSEHTDDEGGEADHDTAVGLGLLRIEDEPHSDGAQQYRHQQIEPPERPGHEHLDEIADRALQVRPRTRRHDQRETEEQEGESVLAVCRVKSLRTAPYGAEHRPHAVRGAQPEPADQPVHAPRGGRCGFGGGFLRRRLPGGRLPGGRGLLRRRLLDGRGFLRRSLRTAGTLRGARRAQGTLAGRT